jgi:copper chaperone CopZ
MRPLLASLLLAGCAGSPSPELAAPAGPTFVAVAEGVVCNHCVAGIEKTLRRDPAVTKVVIDMDKGLVRVSTRADRTFDAAKLRQALLDAGYGVVRAERE